MKKCLNCIIIDDEPLAQELIEKFIKRVSYLSLLEKFDNAVEAIGKISILKPDIVFLDVQMPEMTGVELLQSFGEYHPTVILISAHSQYALDGFEYDAVDYLLKPVAFSRFMKAIHKALVKLNFVPSSEEKDIYAEKELVGNGSLNGRTNEDLSASDKFFMVKADKKLIKINLEDIVYVEGMKDYVKIHFHDRCVITHSTMTKIEGLLPTPDFIRINRSFIVQLSQIKLLEGNMIETRNGKKLMIGVRYRESIKEKFSDWTL